MKKLAVILVIISSISITAAELRIKDKAEDLTVQEKTEEKYIYLEEKSPPIIGDPELNCIAAQKMCIINGFKVDGKIPNEAELQDLKMIVKMLNFAIPDGGIINVTGHTDSTGSEIYNKKLSTERAKNIAVLLRKFGLKDTVRIGSITGQGIPP